MLKVGCRWRDVPVEYDPAKTVYNRYHRWSQRRIWHRIFEKMAATGPVPQELSIDSKHIKAHRSAQSSKGGVAQAIGTSRGGRTSKIHCLADDRGRPIALALTPGNVSDIKMAIPLLEVAPAAKRLIADKAYDADSLRQWLAKAKIKAVIPSSAARKYPIPSTGEPIAGATSSSACSASSKTGGASQQDMTSLPTTTLPPSLSF